MNKTDETIISNIKKRKEEISSGQKDSNIKTCLIVQGGGMRASYSMGALLALEELGFTNAFDYIIGSSAGAINGTYFLAHQAKIATEVYSDYIDNNKFINFLHPRRMVNVEYLLKVFSEGITALNKENIISSHTDLKFLMIHYPTGKNKLISAKDNPTEILKLIEASATIPALSNQKIEIAGEKYIDGAIFDPIPIKSALELGCTDIVIILTRSKQFRRHPSKFVFKILSSTYFHDWPKNVREELFKQFSKVNDLYDFIWKHEGDNGNYRVMIISPEKDNLAGLLSKSRKNIISNIEQGHKDTLLKFK